eukprot:TCONS_00015824-protein
MEVGVKTPLNYQHGAQHDEEDSSLMMADKTQAPHTEEDTHAKIRRKEEYDTVARILRPYCRFLVRWPVLVIGPVMFVFAWSIILSVIPALGSKDFPDFSEPTKGFEPRGTDISKRAAALSNLDKNRWGDYQLTNVPGTNYTGRLTSRKRRSTSLSLTSKLYTDFYFIYKASGNILTAQNLNNLCRLHKKYLRSYPRYDEYFNTQSDSTHHLANYIAALNNLADCDTLQENHVDHFKNILKQCYGYYKNGTLKTCVDSTDAFGCTNVKQLCHYNTSLHTPSSMKRLVYNSFYYLIDSASHSDLDNVQYTASIDSLTWYLRDPDSGFFEPLYNDRLTDLESVKIGDVQVAGFNMWNLKFYLFQTEIITQSLYIIAAIVLVILFIWFYSGSIFIGLMTLACIIIALAISYFVYGRVFDMNFFPFLNMVTLIFIVGIGADDAFVYTGIWGEARQIYPLNMYVYEECLIKWTIHSIRHALLAMLVTSLTTASAFYANVSSVVTSVKCFGLFAGTSIIINYLLMITLFPAVVILHEKYLGKCMSRLCPGACKDPAVPAEHQRVSALQRNLDDISNTLFSQYLPTAIIKFRWIWIVFLLALGIGGCVVTFSSPGLNPPSTGEFQMFTSGSPLEQYDLNLKKLFASGSGSGGDDRHVSFMFGIKAVDNGYHFDPDSRGTIELYDGLLDLGNVQTWLKGFCENLIRAPFIQRSPSCANLQLLYDSLEGACPIGQTTCCNLTLPVASDVFMKCFHSNIEEKTMGRTWFTIHDPIFDETSDLKVILISAETTYRYTDEFGYNRDASEEVDSWFNEQYSNITSSKFPGFWYIENHFYDLQLGLFEGTKESLGIAIGVAFIVILLTTLNVFLSLYSILTITFIISVTVGVLVLSGWKLNILESIVFSVAAGLSADFTLHYSVAYQTSLHKHDRVERVKESLSHIGPAILMGACTTFIAGLVMTPSAVLVYLQMAQFLMLVMFISWLFSTFFFLPVCAVFGPTGNMGQLTCKKVKKVQNSIRKNNNSTTTTNGMSNQNGAYNEGSTSKVEVPMEPIA